MEETGDFRRKSQCALVDTHLTPLLGHFTPMANPSGEDEYIILSVAFKAFPDTALSRLIPHPSEPLLCFSVERVPQN